jgi:hypothetical protein
MSPPLIALGILPLFHRNYARDETEDKDERDQPIIHAIPV